MFTKEQLKSIEKYLSAYQITSGEFLEDPIDQQELQNIITTVKTKIEDFDHGPISLKPCQGNQYFDIDVGYSRDLDMTFLLRRKYEHGDVIGEEVCGFYHGEPFEHNETFINDTFWEDEED